MVLSDQEPICDKMNATFSSAVAKIRRIKHNAASREGGTSAEVSLALVAEIRSGNPAAEERLCVLFMRRITYVIRSRVRNPAFVEELVQDTLIIVLRSVREGKLEDERKLPSFVWGVAKNVARQFREGRREQSYFELEEPVRQASRPVIEQTLVREQLVRRALRELKPRDLRLLGASLVDERSDREIASELGVSEEVVRKRRSRAVEKMTNSVARMSRSASGSHHDQ